MATMGPTRSRNEELLAGSLLKLARVKRGLTQRQLAELAGVPQAMISRIERSVQQPTLPTLTRLLAAADLDLRTRLEDYDDHDDVLDWHRSRRDPHEQAEIEAVLDCFAVALRAGPAE